MVSERLKKIIRDIPDFPKEGILFKDITPMYTDPKLCRDCVEEIKNQFSGTKVDAIAGIEARGFMTGILLAQVMEIPFIPIRKEGKLPGEKISKSYDLEYGSAIIEMHKDSVVPGMSVLVHDDLLATGGSAAAAAELLIEAEAEISGFSFLINLSFLNGTDRLASFDKPIHSIITY